jgi:hypothetical protein
MSDLGRGRHIRQGVSSRDWDRSAVKQLDLNFVVVDWKAVSEGELFQRRLGRSDWHLELV